MGALYKKPVDGPAELGIWKISEDTDSLRQQVLLSDTEEELFAGFRTETRKKQWLAYRRLIRELISPQQYPVHYDDSGKPFLAGSDWHISVTHTGDYAGVILSRDVKVGIDMELVRSRIDRVKDKFLSDRELACIDPAKHLEQLTLAWCAKESIYKLYGWRNLDFRKHIHVHLPSKMESGIFSGEIILPSITHRYKLFVEMTGELMVVWAIETASHNGREKTSSI